MNAGIETQVLSYVLKNSGKNMRELFDPVTADDVKTLGKAMDDAHRAMGISHRYGTFNPFIPKVSADDLFGMLSGVHGVAARNLDRTLELLFPDYSPMVDKMGVVPESLALEVASHVDEFLATHPGAAERQEVGEAFERALKDPGFREAAKLYRLGLQQVHEYDGPSVRGSDVLKALGRLIRKELGLLFPNREQQIELYLRGSLKIL